MNYMRAAVQWISGPFRLPKLRLCPHYTLAPGAHPLLSVSVNLQGPHISGIAQCPPLPAYVTVRFNPVVAGARISFLFKADSCSIVWIRLHLPWTPGFFHLWLL